MSDTQNQTARINEIKAIADNCNHISATHLPGASFSLSITKENQHFNIDLTKPEAITELTALHLTLLEQCFIDDVEPLATAVN